jgi:hypothetical protein
MYFTVKYDPGAPAYKWEIFEVLHGERLNYGFCWTLWGAKHRARKAMKKCGVLYREEAKK